MKLLKRKIYILFIFLCFSCFFKIEPEYDNFWDPYNLISFLVLNQTAGNRSNDTGSYASANLLTDGNVLVIGGYEGNGAQIYNPTEETFSSTSSSMSFSRSSHKATLLQNGNVLVTGGFDGTNSLSEVELFDPQKNTFSLTSGIIVDSKSDVELEFLQNDVLLGKSVVKVEVDKSKEKVRIESLKGDSQFQIKTSIGGAISKKEEFVSYYHVSGSVNDTNNNPIANSEVILHNNTLVRTDAFGSYNMPVVQTVKDGKNYLEFTIKKGPVSLCKMNLVVSIDSSTGETAIESQTDDKDYGCPKDVSSTRALIMKVGSESPSGLNYAGSPFVFTKDLPIASVTPTYSGTIESCSSEPSLATGLNLSSTCEISGTPSVDQSPTEYTITAANSNGSTNTTISIEINNNSPSNFAYSGSPFTFTNEVAVGTISPSSLNGTVSSCTASPTLPNGISIDNISCEISGTPSTKGISVTTYTITASNYSGSVSTTISINVRMCYPWGCFEDLGNGTVRFDGMAGTFGGQTYSAQTLYFMKCSHGQTWDSNTNSCDGSPLGRVFCTTADDSCDNANVVTSGEIYDACNGYNSSPL